LTLDPIADSLALDAYFYQSNPGQGLRDVVGGGFIREIREIFFISDKVYRIFTIYTHVQVIYSRIDNHI